MQAVQDKGFTKISILKATLRCMRPTLCECGVSGVSISDPLCTCGLGLPGGVVRDLDGQDWPGLVVYGVVLDPCRPGPGDRDWMVWWS
jgi:hypothetical protein